MSVSTEPFKDMGPVQLQAQMRKMQREKGIKRDEPKTPKATIDQTLKRINAQFANEAGNLEAETQRRIASGELAARQAKAMHLWRDARVPERHSERKAYDQASVVGRKWAEALSKTRNAIQKNGQVALIGGFGSGKTQIAVEMIREVTSGGKSALFTTSTQFLRDIKACYRDETKTTETEIISRHIKPFLVVIDEFHRRKGSDWENEQLFDLTNQRYNALKPLILICNQSRAEFEAAMDGAILDRMNETGGVIECNWPSFRNTL